MTTRKQRYGQLMRGWDWRTRPARLERMERRRQELGLSRTEYLEYCIDKEQGMDIPVFEHRTIDGQRIAVVKYPDGSLFTTGDWQGPQPQAPDEVPGFTWYMVDSSDPANTDKWRAAIMLFGWPRIL